ncbi:MAG TPA: right-handed parallel beta-helix repeat-containing protein [Polyangiaceae bacterium]|nr:right-handed parallel beta-helix repeat-containing protein [Polyangiaceae bacterium]
MKKLAFTSSLPLLALLVAVPAHAADWYVSPTGTEGSAAACATRATPCSLANAAAGAVAGDTVYLTSGSYQASIYVANSGTATAPITFKADACSTPIIESMVSVDADQTTAVYSEKAEYLVFDGLVVRGWSTGFGNGWAGGTDSTAVSNGHWTIKNCISYSNGRTGFTFFSAPSFTLQNSISAHNGSSTAHSWSSGVTLYEATGTNLVQGVVSFENTDEQQHTDGSGFIVDEESNGATFINNIAFGNSGSCFRLTKSSGTTFVNNTCYHNAQFGSQATGPDNPSELYFTNGGVTIQNVNFANNVIVGTGTAPAGSQAIQNKPSNFPASNLVSVGSTTLFTAPDGMNPDFTLAASASTAIGKGTTGTGVPTTDIGFDPKCLVKRTPKMYGMVAGLSRWQYDIDIDYVTMKGGVAKCFNAATRSGTPDIGAYKNGAVTTAASCMPAPVGGGAGSGGAGSGGSSNAGGAGQVASAGAGSSLGGASSFGGAASLGGASTLGGAPGAGGTSSVSTAGSGTAIAGGVATNAGSSNTVSVGDNGHDAGCGCRVASSRGSYLPAALGLFGVLAFGFVRRRRDRV